MGGSELVTNAPPVIVFEMRGRPMVEIGRSGSRISIKTLLLFDEYLKNIVDISDDKIWISPEYEAAFIGKRNGLVVFDHNHDVMFNLTYSNPTTIVITGVFRYGQPGHVVTFYPDGAIFPNDVKFAGTCVESTGMGLYGFR